jgi:hypothetical protein
MREIEKILNIQGTPERHREGLLARLAAQKIENPHNAIEVPVIFQDILIKIQEHYYGQRKAIVQQVYQAMLALGTDEERGIDQKDLQQARDTYKELERRFAYDAVSARESLKFMLKHNKKRKK